MTKSFLNAMAVLGIPGSIVTNTQWNNNRKIQSQEITLDSGEKINVIFLVSEDEKVQWSPSSVDSTSDSWEVIKGEISKNLPAIILQRDSEGKGNRNIINPEKWGKTFLDPKNKILGKFEYTLTVPDIVRNGFELESS